MWRKKKHNMVQKIGLIVVDLVHDFVDGKFGSDRAERCVENITKLVDIAHKKNWPVVFTRDTHIPGDQEFKVWGKHSVEGEESSELIKQPSEKDFVVKKMRYDAFFESPLDTILRTKNIDKVIIAGISTDICVQHTCSGAFYRNYDIVICEECTEAIDEKSKQNALGYIEKMYGADRVSLEEIKKW
ncbi:MAG: isochorismatase family cysteine hydrolase [Candidatus Thermoplasmatota archaeon]